VAVRSHCMRVWNRAVYKNINKVVTLCAKFETTRIKKNVKSDVISKLDRPSEL
jgi:hypothetical protein